MKTCPKCNTTYSDETLNFCLADGAVLSADPDATLINPTYPAAPSPTQVLPATVQSPARTVPLSYVLIGLLTLIVGGGAVALYTSATKNANANSTPAAAPSRTPAARQTSDPPRKEPIPTNVALHKPVSIVTNGADDNRGVKPADVTDGSLEYVATGDVYDSCIGWQNYDYGELMVVNVTIDLQQTYNISKIRYNMGNVTRAESWNADVMVTPFGSTKTNPGSPFSGAWTEQTGSLTASSVTITLKKTRTSPNTDWLFIGEIEVIGTPTQ